MTALSPPATPKSHHATPTRQQPTNDNIKSAYKLEHGIFEAVHRGLMSSPVPLTPPLWRDSQAADDTFTEEFHTPIDDLEPKHNLEDGPAAAQALAVAQRILFPLTSADVGNKGTGSTSGSYRLAFSSVKQLVLSFLLYTILLSITTALLVSVFFLSASVPIGSATMETNQVMSVEDISFDSFLFSGYSLKSASELHVFTEKPLYLSALKRISASTVEEGSSSLVWLNVGSVVHTKDDTSYRIASKGEHVDLKSVDYVESAQYNWNQVNSVNKNCDKGCSLTSLGSVWVGNSDHHSKQVQIVGSVSLLHRTLICSAVWLFAALVGLTAMMYCMVQCKRRRRRINASQRKQLQVSSPDMHSLTEEELMTAV